MWAKEMFPIFKCLRLAALPTRPRDLPGPHSTQQTTHTRNITQQYAGHVREDYSQAVMM